MDFDYADKLGPAEREWLERFGREYYGADAKALKAPDALHCTNELRADVYGAQNAAYRDTMSYWVRGGDVGDAPDGVASQRRWGEHVEPEHRRRAKMKRKERKRDGP